MKIQDIFMSKGLLLYHQMKFLLKLTSIMVYYKNCNHSNNNKVILIFYKRKSIQVLQSTSQTQMQNIEPQTLGEQSYIIPSDKYVILVDNRNQQRLMKLSANRKFNWRKTQINLQELKKHQYYQLLQVGNNTLKKIQFANPDSQSQAQDEQGNIIQNAGQISANNKQIYTLAQAQKLHPQQIQKLKKQKKGEQIICQLIANNQQFQKRTSYSKAKYLKKKQRKYIFNFYVQPVTLDNMHQYYFRNDFKTIGGIRWDMFALMMIYAGPVRRVLLGERTKGILLGAVLVKGAIQIASISFQQKTLKQFPLVEQLNISGQYKDKVTFHTWESLKTLQLEHTGFNSFVLLGNYDFTAIIEQVEKLKLLSLGCSISFFCQSPQPILDCFNNLRKNHKNYLNVKVYDSWCRQYQVLKNRTHPLMYMDSKSGYILTAIRSQ